MPAEFVFDPAVVGANIAHSRKKVGITQDALAKAAGISRPILVAIESGQRRPTELQLTTIAEQLQSSVHYLLSMRPPDAAISVRFRALRGADQPQAALDTLEDYGRRYLKLEELTNDRIVRREQAPISLERVGNLDRLAEELASTERLRLGLGDGPLPDLRVIFEEDAGFRIFGLDELRKTKVSGLFIYSQEYGALVGFNSVHDARRVRWTLCHEYAHYLTQRYDPEVTIDVDIPGRRDKREMFADAFAARFLMPSTGLSRRFSEMLNDANGEFKAAHLMMLAQSFHVSFQALTQRLEEIGRITRGTYALLIERGFKPLQAQGLLGLEREKSLDRLPFRYIYLAASLHNEGILSEGDVAAYFRTDRLSARELLARIPASGNTTDDSEAGINTRIGVSN